MTVCTVLHVAIDIVYRPRRALRDERLTGALKKGFRTLALLWKVRYGPLMIMRPGFSLTLVEALDALTSKGFRVRYQQGGGVFVRRVESK